MQGLQGDRQRPSLFYLGTKSKTTFRGIFRTLSNINDQMSCKNSWRIKAVHYFCKLLHLRCLAGLWIRLRNCKVSGELQKRLTHYQLEFFKKYLTGYLIFEGEFENEAIYTKNISKLKKWETLTGIYKSTSLQHFWNSLKPVNDLEYSHVEILRKGIWKCKFLYHWAKYLISYQNPPSFQSFPVLCSNYCTIAKKNQPF